jgi:hypothetical protein
MQLDHNAEFDHSPGAPPGQSQLGTTGRWSPSTNLVDHTGTRRVDARPATERPWIRLDVFVPQFALAAA